MEYIFTERAGFLLFPQLLQIYSCGNNIKFYLVGLTRMRHKRNAMIYSATVKIKTF